jgi:hypothetical protein
VGFDVDVVLFLQELTNFFGLIKAMLDQDQATID